MSARRRGVSPAATRGRAIGVVETRGIVALTSAFEAMMKATDVEFLAVDRVGGGIVFGAVSGSTAAVRAAVEAAREAASVHSDRVLVRMYVHPTAPGTALLTEGRLPEGGLPAVEG